MLEGASAQYTANSAAATVPFHAGGFSRIDGVVEPDIAVEIESRVSKQVRGAILDLILHPYPLKLLLLLPVHMSNPNLARAQSEEILERLAPVGSWEVVLLAGTGASPRTTEDEALVRDAIRKLRTR